eukprot:Nk52_evm104s151 gene=Nk52_evmTU104s151
MVDAVDAVSSYLNLIPQRAVLVTRHFLKSCGASLAFGLAGGLVGGVMLPNYTSGILPYLVCSSVGFAVSSYNTWYEECEMALHYCRIYPDIMRHHLRTGFPTVPAARNLDVGDSAMLNKLQAGTFSSSTGEQHGPLLVLTWLILARQTAQKDVEEVEARKASGVVDSYAPQ